MQRGITRVTNEQLCDCICILMPLPQITPNSAAWNNKCIMSWVLWVRSPGVAWLSGLFAKYGTWRDGGVGYFFSGGTRGEHISRLVRVVGRIQVFGVIRLRSLFPRQLFARVVLSVSRLPIFPGYDLPHGQVLATLPTFPTSLLLIFSQITSLVPSFFNSKMGRITSISDD